MYYNRNTSRQQNRSSVQLITHSFGFGIWKNCTINLTSLEHYYTNNSNPDVSMMPTRDMMLLPAMSFGSLMMHA